MQWRLRKTEYDTSDECQSKEECQQRRYYCIWKAKRETESEKTIVGQHGERPLNEPIAEVNKWRRIKNWKAKGSNQEAKSEPVDGNYFNYLKK